MEQIVNIAGDILYHTKVGDKKPNTALLKILNSEYPVSKEEYQAAKKMLIDQGYAKSYRCRGGGIEIISKGINNGS